jgi:hypothetical protein
MTFKLNDIREEIQVQEEETRLEMWEAPINCLLFESRHIGNYRGLTPTLAK